jgi:hypothetical protein
MLERHLQILFRSLNLEFCASLELAVALGLDAIPRFLDFQDDAVYLCLLSAFCGVCPC